LLAWNGNLNHPNVSKDDREAHDESDVEIPNGIEDLESPGNRDMSAAPNVPGLIWPT
jgi:hypothetical protein